MYTRTTAEDMHRGSRLGLFASSLRPAYVAETQGNLEHIQKPASRW